MNNQSTLVRILAARLRITLDQRLGRDTPASVTALANRRI
jgi:hypothetical protein